VKTPYIVAMVILGGSMAATLMAFGGAVAQHTDIATALKTPGTTMQVPGYIVKETVRFDTQRGGMTFDIVGMDPKTRVRDEKTRITVRYPNPKPENFDDAESVEVIGQVKNGVFEADRMLVKCPTKYRDTPSDGSKPAPAKY
jgi:cytochrome c-type biogenesis protein CcmE